MIEICNRMAKDIKVVLGELRRMAWNVPGNRAANMRRRAKLIENYLNKKEDGNSRETDKGAARAT